MAHLPQLHNTPNSAPIKLHAASNTVNPRADHHDMGLLENHITFWAVISQVQIVGVSWPLGGHGVNLFDHWQNLPVTSQLPYGQLSAAAGERADLAIYCLWAILISGQPILWPRHLSFSVWLMRSRWVLRVAHRAHILSLVRCRR